MSASSGDFYNAFADWTGHHGATEGENDNRIGGWNEWRDVFHAIDGVDFDELSAAEEVTMFQDFLVAFYPEQNLTASDWDDLRVDFFAAYDIDPDDFDWEAWRHAMGY